MFNPDEFGEAMGQLVLDAVRPLKAEIEELRKQLAEAKQTVATQAFVREQIKALPVPKDGAPGQDGKAVSIEEVDKLVEARVKAAIAAMPAPKDGADGKDGAPGQDGKTVTLEEIDSLVAEKSARWELDFERRAAATLEKAIDRMPKPKDGTDGKDGRDGVDGLGFDDLQAEYDGERGITLKFTKDDRVKSIALAMPVVIDRGVYKEGADYVTGDGVTWGGSYWIAQQATKAKPDSQNSGFRLAVKKGRDGKDGRNGIDKTAPVKVKE
ncbi:hypothetical protein E8K88_16400 [Lampropedia aestuarii]|uniref:Uncharacterized protein n=1 Tax=Lampropedia aestuarii TaxID=2562762 RepID=A0A4S5BN17_9BURK|nr:hypothetical protein [Lampropedia aestuarii]THJ30946.1 hypothetical protein E8K88_16400 [Lampropedia aestuarii]